jgi:glycosyltransferase involved in cell wall biosynthesis
LSQRKHILLIEAKDEGHHLVYVNALVEAMKSQGHRVTVSLPERGGSTREKLLSRGCRWLDQVDWIPWTVGLGTPMLDAAAGIKQECAADEVFFACIDEWASGALRRAALGLSPDKSLKGKISGIYVRPRPLDPDCKPRALNGWLKRRGWRTLDRQGWLRRILVLDERLPGHPLRKQGGCRVDFMPEPIDEFEVTYPTRNDARSRLGIPEHAPVFLHYGLGTKRKGLHHVLEAWHMLSPSCPAFLLVAGEPNAEFLHPLKKIEANGRALLLDRYIGNDEEKLVMAAADVLLLPYVNHYGSSNVLSRAAAAGRLVLASDQGLIGYRVRRYALGELCAHDDAGSLRDAILRLSTVALSSLLEERAAQLRSFSRFGSLDKIAMLFA